MWLTFIKTYQEIRELSDVDLVDDFVSIRHIGYIGLSIEVSTENGWFDDEYFTRQLKLLKDA